MSLRRASPQDARALAEVHVAAWQGAYQGLLPADLLAGLSVERREAQWKRSLNREAEVIFAFENEGRIVAFGSAGPCGDEDKESENVAELLTLYALPEVWGRGVGRALWKAILSEIEQRAVVEITLWVLDANQRALHFYEAAGFTADGTTKTERWRDDLEILEHRLTQPVFPA